MARLAKSLESLRDQVDKLAPNRIKSSDGWIGDPSHQARKSDHNPDAEGVVRALDITNDLGHGIDAKALAHAIAASHDPRVKYVISDHQIAEAANGFAWRKYSGSNPHTLHFHVSVVADDNLADDTSPWPVALANPVPGGSPIDWPTLSQGARGDTVSKVQQLLGIPVDGIFGAATAATVAAFQANAGLEADGVVGPYTWEKLLHSAPAQLAAVRHDNIIATIWNDKTTAYGGPVDVTTSGFSLPYRFPGERPLVRAGKGGKVITGPIVDVGPWNTNDAAYVLGTARPQAESGTDTTGRHTNRAGIDLTPAAAKALGIDGKGEIDFWEFAQDTPKLPDVLDQDDKWTWPTGDNLSEILRSVLDKFVHGGINNLKVPIGNPINLFKNAMSLMTLAKSVHPSNVTLEKLSEAGVAGLSVLAEHPVTRLQPMITVQPQKEIPMFGANWKTGSTGLLTILGGIGTLFTAISMKNWNPETYIAAFGLIASGMTGLFAKDKNVTGGTTANDPK